MKDRNEGGNAKRPHSVSPDLFPYDRSEWRLLSLPLSSCLTEVHACIGGTWSQNNDRFEKGLDTFAKGGIIFTVAPLKGSATDQKPVTARV